MSKAFSQRKARYKNILLKRMYIVNERNASGVFGKDIPEPIKSAAINTADRFTENAETILNNGRFITLLYQMFMVSTIINNMPSIYRAYEIPDKPE